MTDAQSEKFLKDNNIELKDIQGYRTISTPNGWVSQLSIRSGGYVDVPGSLKVTRGESEGIAGDFMFGGSDTTADAFNPDIGNHTSMHGSEFQSAQDMNFEIGMDMHRDHAGNDSSFEGIVHGLASSDPLDPDAGNGVNQ